MRTSEVLNLAADAIEERGWTFGGDPNNNGDAWGVGSESAPLCLEGGIAAALGLRLGDPGDASCLNPAVYDELRKCPAYQAVRAYLQMTSGFLYDFNDTVGRTADEVVETLRACALIEAAREQTRDHVVTTSANHVRIVAARHDLELVEADGYLLATLFVPALGEAIVYQAPVAVSA